MNNDSTATIPTQYVRQMFTQSELELRWRRERLAPKRKRNDMELTKVQVRVEETLENEVHKKLLNIFDYAIITALLAVTIYFSL